MEENNEQRVNTEEIKKETVDTVNQVRDTIKNVDFKKDTKEATGFVSKMFKDPFGTIEEIAKDKENKYLKMAIILIIVWMAAKLIRTLINRTWLPSRIFPIVLSVIKVTIAPTIGIIVLAGIIYFMNSKAKKSLSTTITAVTVAQIPRIIASIVSMLTIISSSISTITSPFASLCTVISTVLTYFTMKDLFEEKENSQFIKTFVIVEVIYLVADIVFGLLGIGI